VLPGMVASFIAQGMEPWQSAVFAARTHLQAGLISAIRLGERSVLAGDVIDALPGALRGLCGTLSVGALEASPPATR
jgi:ADP-dependent NAD(P)H-hydrate dehydratase / NAD(P)H-hydrate epimerase